MLTVNLWLPDIEPGFAEKKGQSIRSLPSWRPQPSRENRPKERKKKGKGMKELQVLWKKQRVMGPPANRDSQLMLLWGGDFEDVPEPARQCAHIYSLLSVLRALSQIFPLLTLWDIIIPVSEARKQVQGGEVTQGHSELMVELEAQTFQLHNLCAWQPHGLGWGRKVDLVMRPDR